MFWRNLTDWEKSLKNGFYDFWEIMQYNEYENCMRAVLFRIHKNYNFIHTTGGGDMYGTKGIRVQRTSGKFKQI